jgi:hypothetical protein
MDYPTWINDLQVGLIAGPFPSVRSNRWARKCRHQILNHILTKRLTFLV